MPTHRAARGADTPTPRDAQRPVASRVRTSYAAASADGRRVVIRDPYEAPSTRARPLSRRALTTHPDAETAISLDGLDDDALASLARFRGLRALRLSTCEIGQGALVALRSLTALRELALWRCKVTAPGLDHTLASLPLRALSLDRPVGHGLVASSLLPRCEALEALSVDLSAEVDEGIFDALAALPRLRSLCVFYAKQVTDETVPRFASLAALEELRLHGCEGVRGATLDALAPIQNLRALRLVSCDLRRESLAHFEKLRALRCLDLAICKDLDVAALLPLQSLEALGLMSTSLRAVEIEALGDLPNLTHLTLDSCDRLTDALLRALGERLSLRGLGVASTDVRGAAFKDADRWAHLEALHAGFTKIDDAALAHLARLPRLRSLEMVYCNEVTAKGLARVTESPSLVELNAQGVSALDDAMVDAWARRARWEELTVYGCVHVTGRSVVPLMRAHPEAIVRCESHRFDARHLAPTERFDVRAEQVASSEDPSLVALVTSRGAALLVERPSGRRRNKNSIPAKGALVRLDPRGRVLLSCAKKARLWDAATAKELPPLAFKLARLDDAAFSADGARLAIAGLGGTRKKPQRLVYLWDVATWTQLGTIEATQSDAATSVALSPDGRHVLVAHASLEVFSIATAARVLSLEGAAPACFDAKGEAVLFVEGDDVMRAPLDGARPSKALSWKGQLRRAPGVTVLSERAEMAANPELDPDLRASAVYGLTVCGGEVVLTAFSGGYPGATGLVVGARAVWIQCDVFGARPLAVSPDLTTLALGYPQDHPSALDGEVGVWSLDAVMGLAGPKSTDGIAV